MAEDIVQTLRHFFAEHPVWVEAARSVKNGANSEVYFAGTKGQWHLMRDDGVSYLREGRAPSPDLSFVFTEAAVHRLVSMDGKEISDFAIILFDLITSEDENEKVGFRVTGSFFRILRRGYVQVLLKGGPRVLQYAARHGVTNLTDLSRLLSKVSGKEIDWRSLRGEQEE